MQRLASCSVRPRFAAIAGWFVFVALAVLLGGAFSGGSRSTSDAGDSGRVQKILNAQRTYVPTQENVLISGTGDVTAAQADLLATLPAANVRAAAPGLVTFQITGPDDHYAEKYDQAVVAVRAVAGRH